MQETTKFGCNWRVQYVLGNRKRQRALGWVVGWIIMRDSEVSWAENERVTKAVSDTSKTWRKIARSVLELGRWQR